MTHLELTGDGDWELHKGRRNGKPRKGKKLALVGNHKATRENAPFDDETFDIWVLNEMPQLDWWGDRRWTASFQLHLPEIYTSPKNMSAVDHWGWLQEKRGKPIYMIDDDPRVPDCVKYPKDELFATLPGGELKWVTSSPSWALALALYQGYTQIDIYGMELSSNSEYAYQQDNFAFWVGVAYGMGVDLNLYCAEKLFSGPLYGYEGELNLGMEYYQERIHALELENVEVSKRARFVLDKLQNAMNGNQYEKVAELSMEVEDANIDAGAIAGALGTAKEYLSWAQTGQYVTRQMFERSSAQAQLNGEEKKALMLKCSGKVEIGWNAWKQYKSPPALEQMKTWMKEHAEAAYATGVELGHFKENMEYLKKLDKLVIAAGGEKAYRAFMTVDR